MIGYESHIPDKCFGRALLPLKSPRDKPKIAKSEIQVSEYCTQVKHFMGFTGGSDGKESAFRMQETRVQSLDQEDPLEKGRATHSTILAWRIPADRGAW